MTTVGICMVRDEADIIEGTLRHMAEEVDRMLVADNASVDGTRDILAKLATELDLEIIDDPEVGYYQSFKMSALAEHAATEYGADWIVPFDADEIWVAEDRVKRILCNATFKKSSVLVARALLFNHFPTAVDPVGDDLFSTIVWRQREPAPLPKVAFRWAPGVVILQGNHGVQHPAGERPSADVLEIRHFPYRSAEQFVRKARNGAAAYRATDLPVTEGAHWRAYGDLLDRYGEEALGDVFRQHFWFLSPTDSDLVLDPAPYRRWENS